MATIDDNRTPVTSRHSGQDIAGQSLGQKPVCPRCGSSVYRIRRRALDRLLSSIVPVHRYRCRAEEDFHCDWEGILPVRDTEVDKAAYHSPRRVHRKEDRPHEKVPGLLEDAEALGDLSFRDMAQITLDAIGDAVLVVNPQGQVIYLNKVAETMTGWSREEALGRPVEEVFVIIDGTTGQRGTGPSQRAIDEGQIVELALGSVLVRRDGTRIPIEDSAAPISGRLGKVAGAVIVFHDAQQSQFEIRKMSHLAQHDVLTGLPNRVLLTEQLTQALGLAERHHQQVALLFLDLDNFKQVNDSLGHAVGDQLLQDVAENIVACVRATDTVSRHGGDEFVILLPQIEDIEDPTRVAEKLVARFSQPLTIAGHELQVTLSIGISVYPDNGTDASTLMRKADAAMYVSKKSDRSTYQTADLP